MTRCIMRRNGGVAVEFALILPPLLLLILPIIDYTWYFLSLQDVELAAQGAVRTAARMSLEEDPALVAGTTAFDLLSVSMPCCVQDAEIAVGLVNDDMVWIEIHVPFVPITNFLWTPAERYAFAQMVLEDP